MITWRARRVGEKIAISAELADGTRAGIAMHQAVFDRRIVQASLRNWAIDRLGALAPFNGTLH